MFKNTIIRHKALIASVIAVVLFALVPLFVHSPYRLDLLIIVLVNAGLTIAFMMMFRTGLLAIAIAVFWGVGGYASAVLTTKLGLSFWLALPASGLIASLVALVLGILLLGRAGGFAFLMLCVVLGMLFSLVVGNISFLGGYAGIADIPPPDPISIPFLGTIEFTSKIPFFYLALILFVVIILVVTAFYKAWTGRAWTAIGMNSRLAESIGIDVNKFRLLAFVVSAGLAGLIGSFYANYMSFVIGDTYGMWINMYILTYAILGGTGHLILGPIIGTTVMVFMPESLRMAQEIAPVFNGILLILLVLVLPGGLLSLWDRRAEIVEWISRTGKTIGSSLSIRRNAGK